MNRAAVLLSSNFDPETNSPIPRRSGPLTKFPPQPLAQPSPYAQSLLNAQGPIPPTPATTAYFADFAATYYHRRSLHPLTPPDPALFTPAPQQPHPRPRFASGAAYFAAHDAADDALDAALRPWLEECDAAQAVQLVAALDGAWAGVGAAWAERARDALGKTSLWVWAADAAAGAEGAARRAGRAVRRARAVDAARAVRAWAEHASLLVPVGLPAAGVPGCRVDGDVLWETAGLVGAAVESVGLPVRVREGRVPTLRDWEVALAGGVGGRKVAALGMRVPDAGPVNGVAEARGPRGERMEVDGEDADWSEEVGVELLPADPNAPSAPQQNGVRHTTRPRPFSLIKTERRDGPSDADADPAPLSARFVHRPDQPIVQRCPARLLTPRIRADISCATATTSHSATLCSRHSRPSFPVRRPPRPSRSTQRCRPPRPSRSGSARCSAPSAPRPSAACWTTARSARPWRRTWRCWRRATWMGTKAARIARTMTEDDWPRGEGEL